MSPQAVAEDSACDVSGCFGRLPLGREPRLATPAWRQEREGRRMRRLSNVTSLMSQTLAQNKKSNMKIVIYYLVSTINTFFHHDLFNFSVYIYIETAK